MKHRLIALCCALLSWLMIPVVALAEDEKTLESAREYGYSKPVIIESSPAAPQWLLLIVLAGICIVVLFKDAKRTHMD